MTTIEIEFSVHTYGISCNNGPVTQYINYSTINEFIVHYYQKQGDEWTGKMLGMILAVWMSSNNLRLLCIILFMILHCNVWKSDLQPTKKLYKDLSLICPSSFEEIGKATTRVSLTGLLDIFGHHISEPESLEQELVTSVNNWPSSATFFLKKMIPVRIQTT